MSHHLRVGESRCCDPHTNSRSRDFHSSERGFSKIASTTTSPSTFLPLLVHPTSITHFNHRHLCSSGVACKQVACFRSSLPGACCFLLGKPSVFLISSAWEVGPARPGSSAVDRREGGRLKKILARITCIRPTDWRPVRLPLLQSDHSAFIVEAACVSSPNRTRLTHLTPI